MADSCSATYELMAAPLDRELLNQSDQVQNERISKGTIMSQFSTDDLINSDTSDAALAPVLEPPLPPAPLMRRQQRLRAVWDRVAWQKIGLFGLSLFLFILAITLMKEGAQALTPLVRDYFAVTNPANSLGFGWLFAYVVMSGSPVAAAALTFFDAGVLSRLSTFTMITGSRLGAGLIVIFIGFIYVLRGHNKATSLEMGLLSLTVTGSTHAVALIVGLALLQSEIMAGLQLKSGAILNSVTDLIFTPLTTLALLYLPRWSLFLLGLGIILGSFNLFDKCLPQMTIKESQVGQVSRLVYRPWVMFLLGTAVTLISMSVSVSLSILVPLSHRGFVRRENVIPYIMGANITTFVDTLFAAVLLNNPAAFTIVLVEMVTIAIVSGLILLTMHRQYERGVLNFVGQLTTHDHYLAFFMVIIFVLPLLLLLV
jgi:Na+/phosphate symporter